MTVERTYLVRIVEPHSTTTHYYVGAHMPDVMQKIIDHPLTAEHVDRATHVEITLEVGTPGR